MELAQCSRTLAGNHQNQVRSIQNKGTHVEGITRVGSKRKGQHVPTKRGRKQFTKVAKNKWLFLVYNRRRF